MKTPLFIIFSLTLFACNRSSTKTLATEDFKYSAYYWHDNQQADSFEFYLANYIHIDSNGQFELIRHTTFLDKPQYFGGTLSDSIRQIIDSILLENKYYPEIRTDGIADTPFIIYDGFTYLLDYKLVGKSEAKIQYINSSSRIPQNILYMTSLLDKIISETKSNKIDSFSIGAYIDTLKKISSYNLPPPPKQAPMRLKKFDPTKDVR